jgi:hypothetical protein
MRYGQYSFSAPLKRQDQIDLGEEYKMLAIKSGIPFSQLVFRAMRDYKDQGKLPEVKNAKV